MKEEIWKPIQKFDNQYEVSNKGRIRSVHKVITKSNGRTYTRKSKILKPAINHSGYLTGAVSLMNNLIPYVVHRLVAEAFIPNPENKETVNHIDGVKTNNNSDNLEWATRSENCQHSFDIGLQKPKRGKLNGMAKLSESQVQMIRERKRNGGRYWGRNELAKELAISPKHLQAIANQDSTKGKTLWM